MCLPSPSLSNKAKASLNSAIWSSVSWSATEVDMVVLCARACGKVLERFFVKEPREGQSPAPGEVNNVGCATRVPNCRHDAWVTGFDAQHRPNAALAAAK